MLRSLSNKFRKHIQAVAKEMERYNERINHATLLSICARISPSDLSKLIFCVVYFVCLYNTQAFLIVVMYTIYSP